MMNVGISRNPARDVIIIERDERLKQNPERVKYNSAEE